MNIFSKDSQFNIDSSKKDEKEPEGGDAIKGKLEEYARLFSALDETDTDLKEKVKEVQSLIEHVNQRIYYTESRITRTVTFAITLIGIGMAFFAVTINLEGRSLYLGLITSILFIGTGGITSLIHVFQINPKYPFRKLQHDWKWFYPNIVPEEYKPNTFVKERKKKYEMKRVLHVEGLHDYAEKILNEGMKERLKVDIQQLYLLHVNEKYKNCFLSSLRRVLTYGLILIALAFIALFFSILTEQLGILGLP